MAPLSDHMLPNRVIFLLKVGKSGSSELEIKHVLVIKSKATLVFVKIVC